MKKASAILFALSWLPFACESAKATPPSPNAHEHETPAPNPNGHEHQADTAPIPSHPPAMNPVQHEMQLLAAAMNSSLLIITNGDLADLPPVIFAVHAARDATEHAIASGAYAPPANSQDVEGFVATDRAFHDQLIRMVKAAKAGDRKEATAAYADVVTGCTNCHGQYREGY